LLICLSSVSIVSNCRRMFPTLKAKLSGLDATANYYVLLDLTLADDCRYKYSGKEWAVAGKAEPQMPSRYFIHPDSPAAGAQWMKHDVSFQKVKLTNHSLDRAGNVSVGASHSRASGGNVKHFLSPLVIARFDKQGGQ